MHGNNWFLKKFTESRRPERCYVESVAKCLPGGVEFFAGAQRRVLAPSSMTRSTSNYYDPDLARWLDGAVLTPRVPGSPWSQCADDLRAGDSMMSLGERAAAALKLVEAVSTLEAFSVAHRDISASNVFLEPGGGVFFIDWDCPFHPGLDYQPNTTAGTSGYMAPFLKSPSGQWIAADSWCPAADRVALAILVAELLLVQPGGPPSQEDGSLFSQQELAAPRAGRVQEEVHALSTTSRRLASLLQQALEADSFERCPDPGEWRSALRHLLRTGPALTSPSRKGGLTASWVLQTCSTCGATDSIDSARLEELRARSKPVLCNACLTRYLAEKREQQLRQDWERPEVVCEHCNVTFRLSREKLDRLRSKGRPLLCRSCLERQMQQWAQLRRETELTLAQLTCGRCASPFRIAKDKLAFLQSRGKRALCKSCLGEQMQEWGRGDARCQQLSSSAGRTGLRIHREKLERLRSQESQLCAGTAPAQSLPAPSVPTTGGPRQSVQPDLTARGDETPADSACQARPASAVNQGERHMGMAKLKHVVVRIWRALVPGPATAPPSQGQGGTQGYLNVIQGPGTRITTMRVLDRQSAQQGVLSLHERVEGQDAGGGLRQIDAYHATTCGFNHLLGRDVQPKSLCHICGSLMCSSPEGCHKQCEHGPVCMNHRFTYTLGDGKEITYCVRCRWKHWWRLWWRLDQ